MSSVLTCETIEIRADTVAQLFKTFDPTPFPGRDLDPDLVAHIVGRAREAAARAPLGLRIELPAAEAARPEAALIAADFAAFFEDRAEAERLDLRELLRTGRVALAIGLVALGASLAASQILAPMLPTPGLTRLAEESLIVLGWVAMWRPMEIYLYEWWPIRRAQRLMRRLAAAEVAVTIRPAGAR